MTALFFAKKFLETTVGEKNDREKFGKTIYECNIWKFLQSGYDDPDFVDETMELIKNLGYNSVMFDTKDWEDFRERYKTGERSQYVKMRIYGAVCIETWINV